MFLQRASFLLLFALSTALAAPPLLAQSAKQELDETTYIDIAEDVLPSVVNITMRQPQTRQNTDDEDEFQDMMRLFDSPNPRGFNEESGSGVLIRKDGNLGYVLTNTHVISSLRRERELVVTFHLPDETGTEYNQSYELGGELVRLIGEDELSDLAVIEVNLPEDLDVKAIEFANSDTTKIGEQVLALGNPLDLTSTVTHGIISAKSRYLSTSISLEKLLQTDAVIQPGNSGGPLVNLDGKIVGITNAIISRNGMWQGISFAIPSNDAERISDQLIEYGRVRRGFLGIKMANVRYRPDLADIYGVNDRRGVFVIDVFPDTPAHMAELSSYDLVRKIDEVVIDDSDHMLRVIANKRVNAEIDLEIIRLDDNNQPYTFETAAVLTERPQNNILNEMSPETDLRDFMRRRSVIEEEEILGMKLRGENSPVVDKGLSIRAVEDGSAVDQAGLKTGDIIVSVNDQEINNMEDLKKALENPKGDIHMIEAMRFTDRIEIVIPADTPQ